MEHTDSCPIPGPSWALAMQMQAGEVKPCDWFHTSPVPATHTSTHRSGLLIRSCAECVRLLDLDATPLAEVR
jgi:hypothetical protein